MIYLISNQLNIGSTFTKASYEDLATFLDNTVIVGVDTETTGLDVHKDSLLCLQLGNKETQFVIDANALDIPFLKKYFEDKKYYWLFHYAPFDLEFFYKKGIVPARVYDTYIAEAVLYKGLTVEKSLKEVAKKYCYVTLDKDIRQKVLTVGLASDEVIEYAALDVKYLEDIKNAQGKRADEFDLHEDIRFQSSFTKPLAYLKYCGVYVDQQKWRDKCKKEEGKMSEIKDKLEEAVWQNFPEYRDNQLGLFSEYAAKTTLNWNSSKKLIPLFKKLGVDTLVKDKKTRTMKDSIDVKILKQYKGTHPVIDTFIQYSELNKKLSSYGVKMLDKVNKITGRIHANYRPIVDTSRLSSNSPNMQQIPNDYTRECFTASSKDNCIIVADYSGMETIMLAHYAQDPEFTSYLTHPDKDLHCLFASYIYDECKGLPHPEIKGKFKHLRTKAKGATFSFQFGGVGATIASNLSVTKEVGDYAYESVLKTFPNLATYWEYKKHETLKQGYVLIDPIIRSKRFLPEHKEYMAIKSIPEKFNRRNALKGAMERKALNTPIQGTASHIFKLATLLLFNKIVEEGLLGKVLFSVFLHDEICLETSKELAPKVSAFLQEAMEGASKYFSSITMEAKPVISNYWSH